MFPRNLDTSVTRPIWHTTLVAARRLRCSARGVALRAARASPSRPRSPCRRWRWWCFTLVLFWNQIGSGRLLDPAVAVRWGMGALLLVALTALRRAGVPVLWGRRALVVWVLVALLHCTAVPAGDLGWHHPERRAGDAGARGPATAGRRRSCSPLSLDVAASPGRPRAMPACRPRDARAVVRGRRRPRANPQPPSRLARASSRGFA